jgi:hypothetical protein
MHECKMRMQECKMRMQECKIRSGTCKTRMHECKMRSNCRGGACPRPMYEVPTCVISQKCTYELSKRTSQIDILECIRTQGNII